MACLVSAPDSLQSCAPLLLTSPGGTTFPLRGVDELLRGVVVPEHLLTPPDALGVEEERVSPAALVNQLCHCHRLLNVEGPARRQLARIKAADPKATVTMEDLRAKVPEPLARTLAAAADAVDGLRRRSHWHWVDLARLFGSLVAPAVVAPAAAAAQQTAANGKATAGVAGASRRAVAVGGANIFSVRGVVA
ncbi:hypothetical protein GPECTOR_54g232 [Gonium pectorale]|uniref:Uncharacterized protein n=1 Tax=Gonium pectorale TaxID=33097 RepID=A0A150G6P0_GONPE|nr:hypothetical protein GPECTOR_54g232 [Gonium pectorale]|eukprot:KXZ45491.1 hypothetical protein GPECTOR_54g232 [Gonium pectorale]